MKFRKMPFHKIQKIRFILQMRYGKTSAHFSRKRPKR